jgi:hypothetical protein
LPIRRPKFSPNSEIIKVAALVYEVSFKGTASTTLRASFDDCVVRAGHGLTVVCCRPDLVNAVLERLGSFGLELLEVRLVAEPTKE